MESHVLNSYHQARYRTIGHKIMRTKSDSLSSESSSQFNQHSPEYPHVAVQRPDYVENGTGEWGQNQSINTTQSSQDTSSDDDSSDGQEDVEENVTHVHRDEDDGQIEDNIFVQEISVNDDDDDECIYVDDDHVDASIQVRNGCNFEGTDPGSHEDNTLVEGHDYDVITVYTVNPDLDLTSDDDTEDFAISDKDNYSKEEDNHVKHDTNACQTYAQDSAPDISIDLNLDTPVVSNVDEYFLKHKHILESDGLVVKDVDEYFIKDKGKEEPTTVNVDDFFLKDVVQLPEEENTQLDVSKALPNGCEFLNAENIKKEQIIKSEVKTVESEPDNNGDIINESDLEVLPNIEDLKRYLLEEMSYTKFKSIQRSCSLPQSPMQNICMDIDDAKTCLSFEDLNLDLSDLAFDEKDKSDVTNKSDDIPRTLTEEDINSFLITNNAPVTKTEDDLSHQDMEIERTIESKVNKIPVDDDSFRQLTSTPLPALIRPTVLDFCIEKTPTKPIPRLEKNVAPKTSVDIKPVLPKGKLVSTVTKAAFEQEDFVDVESCNDTVIPVLAANNLNSLLEQFEATEKLNGSKETVRAATEVQKKVNKSSLTNGMRLQDAGVQLNKNKMRQILMPSTINTSVKRSPSPIHSDHDYCTSKKRHSLPNIKGGQSLLKPEVLSSNNKILNSRHRSCKNKKIVYALSSDDESETTQKAKKLNDSEYKKKTSVKPVVKTPAQSNCRKKLSPPHCAVPDVGVKDKTNNSVINKSASKASDTLSSQNSICSIKLTIKNKSEVILNCDHKDSQKDKLNNNIEKFKTCSSVERSIVETDIKQEKDIEEVDKNRGKSVNTDNLCTSVSVKEEPRPKDENFYTTLFSNKQDVKIPPVVTIKKEICAFEEELNKAMEVKKEEPQKKKKLNLQEYKLRKGVSSNNSSTTVSPEAIFPDMPNPLHPDKSKHKTFISNGLNTPAEKASIAPKKMFDPIREASRKILMNNKKQKAEALRKRDEDIVMSKIPKVDNLQLQPLISEAEMAKIVGIKEAQAPPVNEKPQGSVDYEEIIMVSIGTNTDDKIFEKLQYENKPVNNSKRKSTSPPIDPKSHINFKIKKSDNVLKQNVFDTVKRDRRSPVDEIKHTEKRIDKERFKDITAVLKSVGKQVDTKMSSNSLFASIQDTVMKKAPEKEKKYDNERPKSKSPIDKHATKTKLPKTTIVKDYDDKLEHGEDKVIIHLGRNRLRPQSMNIRIQTEPPRKITEAPKTKTIAKEKSSVNRRRNDSDMSMSSDPSPIRYTNKSRNDKISANNKEIVQKASQLKEKRSRSKERYDAKYRRRSRSLSRRSRSDGRYRRYSTRRRSDSPYKRKRRSRTRSRSRSRSYHKRRSASIKREQPHRNRSRSRSRVERSKSPAAKKFRPSPQNERKIKSMTPPLRKPTVSESSDSSTSSSSSSSSSTSSSSRASNCSEKSNSPYKRPYRVKPYRSYSSDDRENNTPVEERRIVFVGKLEKDITKTTLRTQFSKFGPVIEIRLHSKEDGSRYGFVTYQRARDAWTAVEAASTFPQYDVGFGGRRAFCRQSYADLDGLEAKYTESAFHGSGASAAPRRMDDMSFEQMLSEMKKKLSQRKSDKKPDKP